MIGLSVSKCIKAMASGEVDPASVSKIIARTFMASDEDAEWVVTKYKNGEWAELEERAESLFWQFWAEGKIYQPRIKEGWQPSHENGIWVKSEDEIIKETP